MSSGQIKTSGSKSYEFLRIIFILGCIFNIGITFVPSVKVGGELMSAFDAIRLAFQMGSGLAVLYVLFFAAWIAFLLLAMVHQKRWVFVTGASVAAFSLLLNLFSPTNPIVEVLLVPRLVDYVAGVFMLFGFIAKPPAMGKYLIEGKGHEKIQYCPNCGSKLRSDAFFCEQCGSKVEG